jgi:GcrA cell cycle regulator
VFLPRRPIFFWLNAARQAVAAGGNDVTFSTECEVAHVVIVEPEPEPGLSRVDLAFSRFVEGCRHCRWPIGDPSAENFRFCGRRRVVSQPNGSVAKGKLSPYCTEHARMAYQPVMSRTSGRPLPFNRVAISRQRRMSYPPGLSGSSTASALRASVVRECLP